MNDPVICAYVPAASRAAANADLSAAFPVAAGPDAFAIPLAPSSAGPATHYGCEGGFPDVAKDGSNRLRGEVFTAIAASRGVVWGYREDLGQGTHYPGGLWDLIEEAPGGALVRVEMGGP